VLSSLALSLSLSLSLFLSFSRFFSRTSFGIAGRTSSFAINL
jgi:hypothetical protein